MTCAAAVAAVSAERPSASRWSARTVCHHRPPTASATTSARAARTTVPRREYRVRMASLSTDELELGHEPAPGGGVPGHVDLDAVVGQPTVGGAGVLHGRVHGDEYHGGALVGGDDAG